MGGVRFFKIGDRIGLVACGLSAGSCEPSARLGLLALGRVESSFATLVWRTQRGRRSMCQRRLEPNTMTFNVLGGHGLTCSIVAV